MTTATRHQARLLAVAALLAYACTPAAAGLLFSRKRFIAGTHDNAIEIEVQEPTRKSGSLQTSAKHDDVMKTMTSLLGNNAIMGDAQSIEEVTDRIINSAKGQTVNMHLYIDVAEATLSSAELTFAYTSLDRIKIDYNLITITARHNATRSHEVCVKKKKFGIIKSRRCHTETEPRGLTVGEHTEVVAALRKAFEEI